MGWVKTEKTNKLSKLGDIDFTTTAPVDGNTLVYDETNNVWVPGEGGGGNANEMVLTQDEYDALTPEEQLNGTNYYINDASVGAQSAAGTPYDNSLSDLLATDVQDAIDELVMGKVDAVNGKGLSTEDYTTAEKTKLSGIPNIPTPTTNDIDKVIKVESDGQGSAQYTLDDNIKNQCGAFVDYTDLIATVTFTNGSASYTATTDCYAIIRGYYADITTAILIKIDDVLERGTSRVNSVSDSTTFEVTSVLLKKGQTLTVENCEDTVDNYIKIYGLQYSSPNLQPVIYSEEEREIGVWTNGKPLYEKTLFFSNLSTGQNTINHNISDVDTIFLKDFFFTRDDGVSIVGQEIYAAYLATVVSFSSTNLTYNLGDNWGNVTGLYTTVQYTKTTDMAGSGTWTSQGVPAVHYSTDEHVVGTWIDGSPVYEKTQYISALPSSIGDWVNYPHGISNFDRLISVSGTAYSSVIPQQLNLPHVATTMAAQITISVSDTDIAFIVGQDRSSWEAYVTIHYTKSST